MFSGQDSCEEWHFDIVSGKHSHYNGFYLSLYEYHRHSWDTYWSKEGGKKKINKYRYTNVRPKLAAWNYEI